MKSKVFLWPVLALAVTLTAQAQQGKFAVINIQGAIISTKDGQKAAAELNAKTAPKKKELEQKQNEINCYAGPAQQRFEYSQRHGQERSL